MKKVFFPILITLSLALSNMGVPAQADTRSAVDIVESIAPLPVAEQASQPNTQELLDQKIELPTDDSLITIKVEDLTRNGKQTLQGTADTSFVSRTTSDGLQLLSVIKNPGEHRHSYNFAGKHLEMVGSYVVMRNSQHSEPIAIIDPAWAKDANGAPVSTHYVVNGDTLEQIVTASSEAAYPVVADPRVRRAWYGISVDLTRGETKNAAAGAAGCIAVTLTVPEPAVSKAAAIICGVVGAFALQAEKNQDCLSFKLTPGLGVIPWVTKCYA